MAKWRIVFKGLNPWEMWCECSTINVVCYKFGTSSDMIEEKEHTKQTISPLVSKAPCKVPLAGGWNKRLILFHCQNDLVLCNYLAHCTLHLCQHISMVNYSIQINGHICQGHHKNVCCLVELLSLSPYLFSLLKAQRLLIKPYWHEEEGIWSNISIMKITVWNVWSSSP